MIHEPKEFLKRIQQQVGWTPEHLEVLYPKESPANPNIESLFIILNGTKPEQIAFDDEIKNDLLSGRRVILAFQSLVDFKELENFKSFALSQAAPKTVN